jgi:serine/threonine protein kinase
MSPPSSILRYYGRVGDGIILEYAEKGELRGYLRRAMRKVESGAVFRWARQAAEALAFSHANGVLHGDINCRNFFLGQGLNLKVADFAGSSVDQPPATICYSATHQLPTSGSTPTNASGVAVSVDTEIFAFGSALYEMVTGREPYAMLSEMEVEALFRSKRFPDLSNVMILGTVIDRCWNLEFDSMRQILECIEQEGV